MTFMPVMSDNHVDCDSAMCKLLSKLLSAQCTFGRHFP